MTNTNHNISRKHLKEKDRILLEKLWNDDVLSQSKIARLLLFSQGTIARELQRGNILEFSDNMKTDVSSVHKRIIYSAIKGQSIANANKQIARVTTKLTPKMKNIIEYAVNHRSLTPEQVVTQIKEVSVSASVIRLWAKKGLINIKIKKYNNSKKVK
ncbi:helix-turn-helix domain-containing protein [Leuconostoc citreum]